jgi:protein arginine N-methyltransferase 1
VLSASDAAQVLRFQSFLLEDAARLDAWEAAIRATIRPGDVVLDLGAGMGILSLFACRAGAARVYAVESAPSVELARLVAADNGLEERIVCLRGRSQDVDLPERADVLVTDTTETFGLNGQILSAVIDARARLLKPEARLLPDEIELRVAPVEAPRAYDSLVDLWARDFRGFDLSAIRPFAANNKHPSALDSEALLAEPAALGALELGSLSEPSFAGRARVTTTRAGTAHGLAGFFAARLAEGITLTNDPRQATVSYVRALLPLAEPLALEAGDELVMEVSTHDGREWSWGAHRTPASGGSAEQRHQATRHGFPRTREELLHRGERPAAS